MSLEYVDDLAPAGWIRERLHSFALDAGAIIPPGFEAYARIFHPATRREGDVERLVTWRQIADANLRAYHSEMQFGALVTRVGTPARDREPQPGLFDGWPRTGTLSLDIARVLVALLGDHTSTPDRCWFAAWEGWGGIEEGSMIVLTVPGGDPGPMPPRLYRPKPTDHPTFALPHRGYYLARGPLGAALETVYGSTLSYQSANIWWPDDRAWCVATEIDFDWTYVGGSSACIAAVLGSPGLEALPARLSDGVTYDADPINPKPTL